MKTRYKRVLCVLLAFALVFSVAGCGGKPDGTQNVKPPEEEILPTPEPVDMDTILSKKKSQSLLEFVSADTAFDAFINDFKHRHYRYDGERIGSLGIGAVGSVMFEREWDSLALCWFDSMALPEKNLSTFKGWFDRVGIDKFGYVWSSDVGDVGGGYDKPVFFRQGWPFPSYTESGGAAPGFEFNGADAEGWTCSIAKASVADGFYAFGNTNVETEIVFENTSLRFNTLHAPFIELALELNKSKKGNISADDLYVYWKRAGDADYGEDRCIKQSEFSTMAKPIGDDKFSETLFLPMYLHKAWGLDTDITAVKLVLRAKPEQTLHINAKINYIRFNYDTRQSANAALLLTAARNYYAFSRDYAHLQSHIAKYRRALQFMLTHLKGETGLLDLGYFAGHDGLVQDETFARVYGHGIGDNYWDILSLPQVNLSSNIYFYKAVAAMRDMERMAERQHIEAEKPSVKGADGWTKDVPYTQDAASLDALLTLVKGKIVERFWNEKTGRLHLGYNIGSTVPLDYGYVAFNLEAIAEGILDGEKAKTVMDWIDGRRIVDGDNARGADIYKFEFAPRTSTVRNAMQYVWPWVASNHEFGRQVQDGGSLLWTSYYDIAARIKVYGADNAWKRFKQIQAWYEKVKAAGGKGTDFYRDYYAELWIDDRDYSLQGGGTDGGLGLDEEFLENVILCASLPLGFMGLSGGETLTVTPNLPKALSYQKIENLSYGGVTYDMAVSHWQIAVSDVRGKNPDAVVKLRFRVGEGYTVYVDGVPATSTREGEYLTTTVPLTAFVAEAKADVTA